VVTGPYRDGKPLDALIAPDRRRQRAMLLVGGGVVVGIVAVELVRPLSAGESPPSPSSSASSGSGAADTLVSDEVSRVVAAHRTDVRRACWDGSTHGAGDVKANVEMAVVIAPDGRVVSATGTGSDPALARCVEGQMGTWRFPAHPRGEQTTVRVPFFFVRE
jgi:hypothetical protein